MNGFYPHIASESDNIIQQINGTVDAGASIVIDSFSMEECSSVYWLVTSSNQAGLRSKQHCTAIVSGGVPKHALPVKLGKEVRFKLNVIIVGNNLALQIENKESFDISAVITRIKTLENTL